MAHLQRTLGNEAVRRLLQSSESSDLGQASPQSAPPSVHDVLRSTGRPLNADTSSQMSRSFGADFGDVRIHTDAAAAKSAAAVNALAYTVGQHVVFGANQYQPHTHNGKRLLAHELTHVMQQSQSPRFALQRACRPAAKCTAPGPGSAAEFGTRVEAESDAIAVASGGAPPLGGGPASCLLPRHGLRATNLEALATGAGLGATIAPGLDGFFINACLSPNDGANNTACSEFPGGPPAGTNPAHNCVQIHTTDEDEATALRARPQPLGDANLRRFLQFVAMVAHESQHVRFDANAGTIAPPAADCNVSTPLVTAPSHTVGSLLSEISAEISEFDVFFRNTVSNPSRSGTFAMQSEEHDIATRGGESILGNIRDLQCTCNCGTVDTFVVQVFNQASGGWSAAEKREFKKAMTDFMPSFWPRALHQR